jgi:hypothetical protein
MFLNRRAYQTLEQDLGTYVTLVGPFIRSLWSLEASHANASDVFVFWLAIAATLEELFAKGEEQTGIPVSLARRITAIFNSRWKEFFSNDVYFVAFALDPRKLLWIPYMSSLMSFQRLSSLRQHHEIGIGSPNHPYTSTDIKCVCKC